MEDTSPVRYIFQDGVVTDAPKNGATVVLSVRQGDSVRIDTAAASIRSLWGEWRSGAANEIRLQLLVNSQDVLEGDPDFAPSFFRIAEQLTKRQTSLRSDVSVMFYNLEAAQVHLRNLLRSYAILTSVIGPTVQFTGAAPVFRMRYGECHIYFDASLTALRSFADSARFLIWRVLDRGQHLPRSLGKLVKADLPQPIAECVQKYLDNTVDELSEYRDNAVHYSPPGARDGALLLWSKGIIHAQVWLPINPSARSLKRFTYEQRDAYPYAKAFLERSYEFCEDLFPALDAAQRERLRARRKARAGDRSV